MSDSTPSPGDIGFFGILRPPAIEDRFRQAFLPDDSRRVQACCAVAAIAASLIATSDYRLFGATLPFVMLVLVRTAFVLISVMVIVRLRRQLTPVALDRATMVWL